MHLSTSLPPSWPPSPSFCSPCIVASFFYGLKKPRHVLGSHGCLRALNQSHGRGAGRVAFPFCANRWNCPARALRPGAGGPGRSREGVGEQLESLRLTTSNSLASKIGTEQRGSLSPSLPLLAGGCLCEGRRRWRREPTVFPERRASQSERGSGGRSPPPPPHPRGQ